MNRYTVRTCWQGDLHFGTRGIGQNARYGFTHGGCGALAQSIMENLPSVDFTFSVIGWDMDDWSHVVLSHPSRPFEVFDVNGWTNTEEILAGYRAYNNIFDVDDDDDMNFIVEECVPQYSEAVQEMTLRVIKRYLSDDPAFAPFLTDVLTSNRINA